MNKEYQIHVRNSRHEKNMPSCCSGDKSVLLYKYDLYGGEYFDLLIAFQNLQI